MSSLISRAVRFAAPAALSLAVFASAGTALAANNPTLTAATVNGGSSVTVSPSTSITASVTGAAHDNSHLWSSVKWGISAGTTVSTCVNIADINNSASTTYFTVTAPGSNGTYNANFQGFTDSSCSSDASSVFSLSNAVTVASAQTITFNTLSGKTYGDADFAVSATASSGLSVSFASQTTSVCTTSGSTVHVVSAGTCTIRASQAGNGTYAAAPNVDRSFTVAQKSLTASLTGTVSKVYDATVTAVLSAGNYILSGVIGGDTVTLNNPSGSYDTKNVGVNKTVSVSALSISGISASNYALSNTTASAAIGTITARSVAIAAHPQTKVYGAADPSLTYSGVLQGTDSFSGTLSRDSGEDVGTYAITQGTLDAGANYSMTFSGNSLTITPANAIVSLSNLIWTYDGSSKSAMVTTNPNGLTYDVTYDLSATPPTNAGSYSVVATVTDPNYSGTASGTLVIDQATQIITFGPLADRGYNSPDFDVSAISDSGLVVTFGASGDCTISGVTVHILSAGNCTITAMQAGDGNYYAATDVPQTFAIHGNTAPIINAIPNQSIALSGSLDVTPTASDADLDTLTFSLGTLPSGISIVPTIDPSTGAFHWNSNGSGPSNHFTFTVNVSDGIETVGTSFEVSVSDFPAPETNTGTGTGGNGPIVGNGQPQGIVLGASTSTVPNGNDNGSTTGQVQGDSTFQFLTNLKLGMSGNDVIELQKVLVKLGFLVLNPPTGYFGNATFDAVKKLQAAHADAILAPLGLTEPTGFVGPMTRAFLNALP